MPLKNYTTKVGAGQTVSQMQAMLARHGARSILVEYDNDGDPDGIAFAIDTPYGVQSYQLPCNWEKTAAVLKKQRQYRDDAHAHRVSWRILKDWLDAQLAIIETEMVSLDQVMLPYMRQGPKTIYELVVDQQLQLEAGDG